MGIVKLVKMNQEKAKKKTVNFNLSVSKYSKLIESATQTHQRDEQQIIST